ncbi:hypothetical protein IE077_003533 [Cardiosporidium cionae]|uniref:Cleavage and polyadenylation specificity factor subunit 2 n=1 Tax=Cardiosporidium cionae TaxID=476202 RepID=A0ABQ7JF69_9APIC|nr:hypothetical protein IE077_003533 [Cardiosporidium cionae]|eukprot:KAF8822524.1 hypothetical protein IE077_003533 [Cardiosporidium cionae]
MLVRVTPLYSGPSWGTLLTIQDKVTILIDCGWTTSLDPAYINKFQKNLRAVDLILLSHSSFNHVGALPYIYKRFHDDLSSQGLNSVEENTDLAKANAGRSPWTIPIVCTDPVYRLGRISIYDVFENRVLYSGFNAFDLKDVDECFNRCVRLRYLQSYDFCCRGLEMTVRPYEAGNSIGGTIWNLNVCGREIAYGIRHNASPQWLLCGAQFNALSGSALFITDVYDRPFGTTHWKIPGIHAFIRETSKTLRNGGSVLIPVDPDGLFLLGSLISFIDIGAMLLDSVFFELIAHFEAFWRNPSNGMNGFPILFLCPIADTVILAIKTMIEWLSPGIRRTFCEGRFNPFDSLKHVNLVHSKDEFRVHTGMPQVIFATPGSLDLGFSRDLFEEFAPQPKNLILFPVPPSRDTFAYSLWSMQHQWGTESCRDDGGPQICRQIQFTKYSQEPLHPDELYQIYLEVRSKQQEMLSTLDMENEQPAVIESKIMLGVLGFIRCLNKFGAVTTLALNGDISPTSNGRADASSPEEPLGIFADAADYEIQSDKILSDGDSHRGDNLPPSFRKFPLGFLQPAFSNKSSSLAYLEADDAIIGDGDRSSLPEKEPSDEISLVQLEGSKYGKIVQSVEKSAWKMFPKDDEITQKFARKRLREASRSDDFPRVEEEAHIMVPRLTNGHYLSQVLVNGMSYKRRRRLVELQERFHSSGFENSLGSLSERISDKEDGDLLQLLRTAADKEISFDAKSYHSSDEENMIPAWRRDLKSILGAEPFRYKSEEVNLSLNCGIRLCMGLENVTGPDLLRQVLLDIAPRRICLLPSCSFFTAGLLSSFLLTSRVPIKEVHSFWRFKKRCTDASCSLDIKSNRPVHLVKSIEIKIPSDQLFVELDDISWKELIRASMKTSNKDSSVSEIASPLAASVNAVIKHTGSSRKKRHFDTSSRELLDNRKIEDEEVAQEVTSDSNNSNGFWTPTNRKPEFDMSLSSVAKILAESLSPVAEDKVENTVPDSSLMHWKLQSVVVKDSDEQQGAFLLGNVTLRNTAEELIKQLPNQVVYAPQGGILTVSNRVAIVQQCSKEKTTWQVEGSLDPAYYMVRKCLMSQFTQL